MAATPQGFSGKRWVFTLNNPDPDFDQDWHDYIEENADLEFSAWQLEEGESGTPHIQGLVIFSKRMRLTGVREILGNAHWEGMRGSLKQALAYVHKEETRIGEPQQAGFYEIEPVWDNHIIE